MRMKSAKASNVGENGGIGGAGSRSEVDGVLGSGVEEAAGSFVALLRKKLVGNAHFDVVSLAGKHEKRFVLRFPTETRDSAIVAASVHVAAEVSVDMSANTHCRLLGGIGLHVGKDGGVWNGFNESCAEHGSGNSENDVGIAALAGERISGGEEIELGDVAAWGVGSAGDDEKGVHVAVGDTAGLLEARFADWAIGSDEPGDDVLCAVQSGDRDQRILRGARAP